MRSKRTIVGWTAFSGLLSTAGVVLYGHLSLAALLDTFNQRATFEAIYAQLYQKEIAANNESVVALGKVVLDALPGNLNSEVMERLPRVDKLEFSALHRILNEDIANLRRRASPDFPVLATPIKLTPQSSTEHLSAFVTSPSAEALDRVPFKSHRAAIHPGMHVHFSPSTNSSPITTRERAEKKRGLRMHFGNTAAAVPAEEVEAQLRRELAAAAEAGAGAGVGVEDPIDAAGAGVGSMEGMSLLPPKVVDPTNAEAGDDGQVDGLLEAYEQSPPPPGSPPVLEISLPSHGTEATEE
jgi:hypothetical protein